VSVITRRLRSLLIALAVLVLSATAALAGRGAFSTQHGQAAGQTEQGDQQAEESEAPDPEDADAPEAPDPAEADSTDAAAGLHPDNHGKLVSEAAQNPTPAGFDNHGAYVRTIAKDNPGQAAAVTKRAATTK
jgi:flagellar biosynthesis/type III secretory pathway M-ring protein FliF/YscJ